MRATGREQRFLDETAIVTLDRSESYGGPKDNFERSQALKALVRDCPHDGVREALEMICVKMSRMVHDPYHEDGPIDIAGYARTITMVLDEEEQMTDNYTQLPEADA